MSEASSSSEPEFKPGGFVPSGPENVVLQEPTLFVRLDALTAGRESPDAMVVTYNDEY